MACKNKIKKIIIISNTLRLSTIKIYGALKCLAKKQEEPVRLEPRAPGLRVKLFATEPGGTLPSPPSIVSFMYFRGAFSLLLPENGL